MNARFQYTSIGNLYWFRDDVKKKIGKSMDSVSCRVMSRAKS